VCVDGMEFGKLTILFQTSISHMNFALFQESGILIFYKYNRTDKHKKNFDGEAP
jgi:hypothetical protein